MLATVVLTLLIIVSILLIVAVLMQRGTSEFALAFGSNPVQSLFGGTEADTILTKITYFLGALFLALSLLLAVISKEEQNRLLKELKTPKVENQNKTL